MTLTPKRRNYKRGRPPFLPGGNGRGSPHHPGSGGAVLSETEADGFHSDGSSYASSNASERQHPPTPPPRHAHMGRSNGNVPQSGEGEVSAEGIYRLL